MIAALTDPFFAVLDAMLDRPDASLAFALAFGTGLAILLLAR